MPIYLYRCPECKGEVEEFKRMAECHNGPECPRCKVKMPLCPSLPHVEVWEPIHLEHVSPEGKTFQTKKELIEYCRKNGLESGALL